MLKTKKVQVKKKFKGLRLDLFLAKEGILATRSQARKLISSNQVFLNHFPLKASYRLTGGENLLICLPQETLGLSSYDCPLDIVFEDEEILIVNKPAGLVTHPAPGHRENTLVNILAHKKKLSPGSHPLRPGIVHRLDKDTSGLLILAKTKSSQDFLIQQFKKQRIKKEYWAISLRPPSPFEGEIETWMSRHPVQRKKFVSLKTFKKGSKKAISSYRLFKEDSHSHLSWIKIFLKNRSDSPN